MLDRNFFLSVLFSVLLIFTWQPALAQNEWWEDGCDPRALALIEPTTETFDYAGACAAYRECDPNADGFVRLCQLQGARVLVAQCAQDDPICVRTALLYSAAVQAFDTPYMESVGEIPPASVIEGVPLALTAFQRGDYAGALAAYNLTPADYFNQMIPFSRAIVYAQLGQPDQALEQFARALEVMPDDPLIHYGRALVYGELGRTDEASFDVEWLRQFASGHAELEALIAPLVARYPLDQSHIQQWLFYPVMSENAGVAGTFYTDHTTRAPHSLRLGFYESLITVVLFDALNRQQCDATDGCAHLLQLQQHDGSYRYSYPEIFDSGGIITLTAQSDTFFGAHTRYGFEHGARLSFLLAPEGAPDPRAGLHGERCGVISRLRPSMEIENAEYGMGLPLYDTPNGQPTGSSEQYTTQTITGAGVCQNGVLWWQLGIGGWTPENEGAQYLLNPVTDQKFLFYCPSAPPIRLFTSGSGTVVPGLGNNNLRTEADSETAIVGSLTAESVFAVIDGPICADGYAWWQVESAGIIGWTAEGEGDTYWLAPNP